MLNIEIDLSLSTENALQRLERKPEKYRFVISDIGRSSDSKAGFTLLHDIRAKDEQYFKKLPFFIYSTRARTSAVRDKGTKEGVDGIASSPQELLQLLRNALTQAE